MSTKTTAIDVYLARAAAIHIKLDRLQQLADDHFGHDPRPRMPAIIRERVAGSTTSAMSEGEQAGRPSLLLDERQDVGDHSPRDGFEDRHRYGVPELAIRLGVGHGDFPARREAH